MNIAQNIERARRFYPNKVAIIFEDRYYTYRMLDLEVNRLANALRGMGVTHGDRVALFLPNIPEFAISYLAVQKVGAIAVSVNAMLKQDEVRFILEDSNAQILITTAALSRRLPQDRAALPALRHVLIAEGEPGNDLSLSEVMAKASSDARAVDVNRNTPAAIVYTSGTTGFPKGATLSHGNVVSNAFSKVHYCGMKTTDRMLLFLPLFHCFGQNAILNSGIYACSTIVLQRRFDPDRALHTVTEKGISMFFGVPTIYIRLLNMGTAAYDLSTIRYYLSAAATLPEEIAFRWFEEYGSLIYLGYGLTETSPFASYNHDLKYKFGSIGTPIENVEMKIVHVDTGEDVEPGQPGEIVIRGPNVMLGYWNRPEATADAITNGWFHSGDIGVMDERGYFYIVDRLKDMINVSGFKVYPAEVENVLYQHPAVAEAAVYGMPNDERGEVAKARIVLKEDQEVTPEALTAFCREKMASYKAPYTIQIVDSIPKSATGKILRRVIQQEERLESEHDGHKRPRKR